MRVLKIMNRILEWCAILSFSSLIIVVLIQILGRYIPFGFVWTEELIRYLFIFSVVFGAPLAMEKREYISINLIIDRIPVKIRKYYLAFIYLVLGVFCVYLITHAYDFAKLGQGQKSATLKIEMFYIYFSMTITLILLSIYSILNVIRSLKGDIDKTLEEEVGIK